MELLPTSLELSPASLLKLVSFLFWAFIYLWCSIKAPNQSAEWCSRVVTLLHGTVASIVGLTQCGIFSVTPCRLTMKIMPRHYALMVWSWGYFAFDLLWCVLSWTESALMLGHHISALIAITIFMRKENSGCTFACTLAMLEITNPLLQTRWFLRSEGYNKTLIFYIVEVTYLLLFIFLRGVLGTYLMYKIIESDLFNIDEKMLSLVFYIVSLGFIRDIVGFVYHKYKNLIGDFRQFLDEMGILLLE